VPPAFTSRRLLVAAVGVATINYAACKESTPATGNVALPQQVDAPPVSGNPPSPEAADAGPPKKK
jgi:hypothetical protein